MRDNWILSKSWGGAGPVITAAQLRAARALLGIDQRELAQRCSLSLPTIQRMEGSEGVIRGNVDSLMKLVEALSAAGIELIGDGTSSTSGGRGVRLKSPAGGDGRTG
jgi:transcriptional regulator with XRE-family HTH domain